MRRTRWCHWFSLAILLLCWFSAGEGCSYTQKDDEEPAANMPSPAEAISTGILEVPGTGRSRTGAATDAEKKTSAEAAARAIAQVKLAQELGGLRISGTQTLKNEAMSDQTFELKLDEYRLRYAHEVGTTSFQKESDGSMRATVRMQITLGPLRQLVGEVLSKQDRQNPVAPAYATHEDIEALKTTIQKLWTKYQSESSGMQEQSQQVVAEFRRIIEEEQRQLLLKRDQLIQVHPESQRGDFTGLIVDTRGLNVKPGLAAKVYTRTGEELYGYALVASVIWQKHGMVAYARNPKEATQIHQGRIGAKPLVVKAISVHGEKHSGIVVEDDDAVAIFAANLKRGFLQEGRVVFVIN